MSIWDMIKNDKVEWKRLGEVCEVRNGYTPSKRNIDFWENGEIPWFRIDDVRLNGNLLYDSLKKVSKEAIKKDLFKENSIIISTTATIGVKAIIKVPFICNQQLTVITPSVALNVKYLYYYLDNIQNEIKSLSDLNGSLKIVSLDRLKNIKIPIPSLETQEKIAEILYSFEKNVTELKEKLSIELQLRNKQYNYYRDYLLSEEKLLELSGVELETFELKEISYYSKERIDSQFLDENNYVGVEKLLKDRKGKIVSSYVPNEGLLTKFSKNDVLIGNIRPYLKKIWFSDIEGGTNGDVLVIKIREEFKNRILPKYLYHILSSNDFFDYNISFSKGAKMPRGDKSKIMEYICFIPPLSIQTYIVSILDSFDSMVNDIRDGLPREIELRQKQYEYYREKLFSFS